MTNANRNKSDENAEFEMVAAERSLKSLVLSALRFVASAKFKTPPDFDSKWSLGILMANAGPGKCILYDRT